MHAENPSMDEDLKREEKDAESMMLNNSIIYDVGYEPSGDAAAAAPVTNHGTTGGYERLRKVDPEDTKEANETDNNTVEQQEDTDDPWTLSV